MTDLETFLQRVDRIRAEDLLIRAARPRDAAAHASALEAATNAAGSSGLDRRVRDARHAIDEWVVDLFNRSTVQPGWWEANWGRPETIEDRANLAHSLGEAITAILLGDRLDAGDRDELLGAWADLAPRT